MISAQPHLSSSYHTGISANDGKSRCFEILGFDIMLDENADPWLIEVNSMPSLAGSSEFDNDLKTRVIAGTLRIIDLQPAFKSACEKRLKSLSTPKLCPSGITFDPQHESELALLTEWEQLLPVVKDSEMEALCERALVSVANRPLMTNRTRTESKIEPEKPLPIVRSLKKLPPQIDRPKLVVVVNPKPATAKPAGKLIPRTPRSVVLGNAARSMRIETIDKRSEMLDAFPIFAVFIGNEGHQPILESEERARLIASKKQTQLASAVDIAQAIRVVFPQGKTAVFHAQSDKGEVTDRKSRVVKLTVLPPQARVTSL
jgi:tubulin polyglutamylase TTLL6/13